MTYLKPSDALVVIEDEKIRRHFGFALHRAGAVVLTSDEFLTQEQRELTVVVTPSGTLTKPEYETITVELLGIDYAAELDGIDPEHTLGDIEIYAQNILGFFAHTADYLDPDDADIPTHVRELFGLDEKDWEPANSF